MFNWKSALVALSLCLGLGTAHSQLDEFALNLGGATYYGDLTPTTSIFSTGVESYSVGASVNYNLLDYLALRGQVSFMQFSGDDKFQKDEGRRLRNLSFRNKVLEGALLLDFNVTDAFFRYYERLQLHAIAGIAVYSHDPEAQLGGTWHKLRPLGTEGQLPADSITLRRPTYGKVQVAVPLGIAIEYELNNDWSIALEYLHRITFTDYLDDVSTRYPDLAELEARNGSIARQLSFRTNELEGVDGAVPLGIRGNSEETDAFATLQLRLIYRWQGSKSRYYNRRNR